MSIDTFEKLPGEKREAIISAGIREFSRKTYTDASTDTVTSSCGISKGILFHYFGSKRNYYLYCLDRAMERLTPENGEAEGEDFYGIIFGAMERKFSVCRRFSDETRMVNMASRDASREIAEGKAELMGRYASRIREESMGILLRAVGTLKLRDPGRRKLITEGLFLYVNALINRYLLMYLQQPDMFFENASKVKKEMREYLDLMLCGICRNEEYI